ncbi:hypothetical protein SAMN05216236_15519 [Sedimentitalea nanhaiensis]|uniref:Uncharacterized protein n=1 Tax=Sedimentitalea nanhaiensis TaxID=999627 RepID=A0A1I7EAP8_9RHOB|nr:hypothetical protein SAMN05216236_15519 [Sedimentitalea nanhaiensis]
MGVFTRIVEGSAAEAADRKSIMIDATCLKARRTASGLRLKRGRCRLITARQGIAQQCPVYGRPRGCKRLL